MLHQILMKAFVTHDLLNAGEIIFFGALIIVSALSYMLIERPARNAVRRATTGIHKSAHLPATNPANRSLTFSAAGGGNISN
jgi:peptidoglycan/LPS O-acetylase OafA/YrhL